MITQGQEILRNGDVRVFNCLNDYFLYIGKELWMWDTEEERVDQKTIADRAFGDVLVGGYGFGLVQSYLLKKENVDSVLSVEINPRVIDVARELYGEIFGDVEIGDFYDFNSDRRFDCVIGDLWKDCSSRYVEMYVRFRERAEEFLKPNGKIFGWGFEYMGWLLNGGR